jgi:hypothetical protein
MEELRIWHYARLALAESYPAALNPAIAVSTTIFAPCRMGNTTFLRRHMIPAAPVRGHNRTSEVGCNKRQRIAPLAAHGERPLMCKRYMV